MIGSGSEMLSDSRVAVTALESPEYARDSGGESAVRLALRQIARELGWDKDGRGAFGGVIPAGARVLIKPNLVLHENEGPWGIEPLVTNLSLIAAAVEEALLAGPAEVLVGDAPVQGCDFERLLEVTGMGRWAAETMRRDSRFKGVRDFRRTTCVFVDGVRHASEGRQSEDHFVLFDLGARSLLEPISGGHDPFRVTCYDPRLLARTHSRGKHQYLVAREVVEADVVINLPKLKTHKKAGITNALKNLIGINGNKEYLPHHRIGGAGAGGDCYPDRSLIQRAMECISDRENTAASVPKARAWHAVGRQLQRVLHLQGDKLGIEGSWSGNDTIWRTCLDLNRILLYGRPDGSIADEPARQVLHIVDAVIAGQGDGPLRPQPLPLGMILAGRNAAAVDWVGALLLEYDPERISIVNHAFGDFQWPLTRFSSAGISVVGDWKAGSARQVFADYRRPEPIIHPMGWRDAARSAPKNVSMKMPLQAEQAR